METPNKTSHSKDIFYQTKATTNHLNI